jgi:hypothetical protein
MKSKLTRFHLYLLAFLVFHFFVAKIIGFGFNQTIIFLLKVILCLSGLVLFFYHLKPFRKLTLYFSYYFITPIVVLLGYLFGGVFLVGILMSVLLFPIMPRPIVFEKEDIVIHKKYQGFMGACCIYEVYQKKHFLFEKYRSEVYSDGADYESFQIMTESEMRNLKQQSVKD